MKVLIDIPNKFVELVKGIMLSALDSEDAERQVRDIADIAMKSQEPILADPNVVFGDSPEDRAQYAQIMMAITAVAITQIKCDQTQKESTNSSLTARLESLQRQAEELKRKIQEGKI